ncbi:MAG: hypothetical protein WKF94_11515 [Solirubrobacteraceae bacterium]
MRRILCLLALLLAAAPAQAVQVRVGEPGAKTLRLAVRTVKPVRLVSPVTDPRTVRSSRAVKLRLTRAGRATLDACARPRLVVRAFRDRGPRRAATPAGRGRRNLDCTPRTPEPVALDLPDGTDCDQLDPALCLLPFPSDRFTVRDPSTDTGRRVAFPAAAMPANEAGVRVSTAELNRNDGFSPGTAIVTRVPGLDSPEALARTGAVPIDDIGRSFDRRQPVVVVDARTGRRHPVWTEIDVNPADPADRNVIVRPARNFLEGHRYVVGLRRMRTAEGKRIAPGAAFRALRDGVVTDDAALEARRARAERTFLDLSRAGVRRDDLFLAWDFTVASERNLTERMLHIRDDAFEQLGDTDLADLQVQGRSPKFAIEKVAEDVDDQIMRQVEGTITVPCYLNLPGCASGSTFNYGDDGLPAANGTVDARFTCNIPRVATAGAALRPGIYGHGLLGSRGEVNQGQLKTLSQNHGFVFCATDWIGMSCADLPDTSPNPETVADLLAGRVVAPNCDIPTVGTILADISNFPKLGDRVQQGILDFLFLGRAMIHADGLGSDPAFQVDGKSVLDRERLYYDGNSQGGIIGGALMAVAPDNDRGVLGVPGMNYSTLLRRSVDFDTYAQFLYSAYPDELERPVLLQLLQMQWDRAEANGYAHHMTSDPLPNTPPHEVLMHVGLGDHQVTSYAAKVEARTIGARALAPWAQPGRDSDRRPLFGLGEIRGRAYKGSAIVLWDSGSPVPPKTETPPREGQDSHEFPRRSPSGMRQKSAFLRAGGTGRVIDVCGAAPCLAGDKAADR